MLGTVSANGSDGHGRSKTCVRLNGLVRRPRRRLSRHARPAHARGAARPALSSPELAVARWLEERPEVMRLLHPALASHPGHAHLETRFHRRIGPVQRRAQAGAAEGGLRLPRHARTVRHRRLLGRLREPSDRLSTARRRVPQRAGSRAARRCASISASKRWRTSSPTSNAALPRLPPTPTNRRAVPLQALSRSRYAAVAAALRSRMTKCRLRR